MRKVKSLLQKGSMVLEATKDIKKAKSKFLGKYTTAREEKRILCCWTQRILRPERNITYEKDNAHATAKMLLRKVGHPRP